MRETDKRLADLSLEEQRALLVQLLQQNGQSLKMAPLSFSQERLWFYEQLEPGSISRIILAVRLTGKLNVAALEQSLDEVVRRHETLRTTFIVIDSQPRQVIAPPKPLPLPVIDFSLVLEEVRLAEAMRQINNEVERPLDLMRGPLFKASLLQLSDQDHILLLVVHHIISDGWSSRVLIRELWALYQAFSIGRASPLPDLPIQYSDFARWQRERLQGLQLETQLSYWRQKLSNAPTLELPTDWPRLPGQAFHSTHQPLAFPKSLSQAIKALSQQAGITLFMALLAGFQVLLSRYAAQEDVSVGTFIANRILGESEELIGLFINTLVLRTDLSGNPTFRELLGRVREVTLGAYANQDVPFEKLLEELRPERDLDRTPLFQATLVLQNVPLSIAGVELHDLTVQPLRVDLGVNMGSDLALVLWEADEGLTGFADYNTNLFDATTIAGMVQHWQNLLAAAAANPHERIAALPMMTAQDLRRLVIELNQTQVDYPTGATIQELFEAQAGRQPDAIAVSFAGEALTCAELNARANQLAFYLRRCGVGPDVVAGVAMTRSLEMMVALLGVLKAGGAYLPLDPTYPPERLAFMVSDTHIQVLLTQERLAPRLPACDAPLVALDGAARDAVAQECADNPEHTAQPAHLAYVIYTSGSTGQPKGTMIPQRALVNYATAAIDDWDLTPDDRVLQFASISFDTAAEEIYPCLLCGANLVLRTETMLDSVETFLQACAAEGITLLDLPTAYWHSLTVELETSALEFPRSLRRIIIGGEKALPERLQAWRAHTPDRICVLNTYGLTEATCVTALCQLTGDEAPASAAKAPIGRPIANIRVYVLDPDLQPVPVGVPGELYIGGDGLARGYVHRAELTAMRFIPDPFALASLPPFAKGDTGGGTRLYKTGDWVRYLPDGNLEFLGRVDHQVIIRGFRVELGEVEAVLRQHPTVQDAAALVREDVPGEKSLVAYIVPRDGQLFATGDLRDFLRIKLPDYAIPAVFVTLEALPLTPSRKVDRRALPAPDNIRAGSLEEFVAPETILEKKLAGIWSQVLKVDPVGIYDNFFDLGGHSLRATQVIYRINKTFQVNLSIRSLFEEPTIAGLALLVEEALIDKVENS